MNTQLLNEVTAFIWKEADLLDHKQYEEWLQLWDDTGLYIVPIDPDATDHENTLNYAHDDKTMRRMRVTRLTGGESVSTHPASRTVRLVSRFSIVEDDGRMVTVRCAQHLSDFHRDVGHTYVADLTFRLLRAGESFKIERKVIDLINSEDVLSAIAYIL